MTFEEAKDQIAKEDGHANWKILEYRKGREDADKLQAEAAELYAESRAKDAVEKDRNKMKTSMPVGEVKAWDFVIWAKDHFNSSIQP